MPDNSLYTAQAGEGIDRDDFINVEISHDDNPSDLGVIFSFTISAGVFGERTIRLLFPDIPHSDRPTREGLSEPSVYTLAEIAEVFMKDGNGSVHPSASKWQGWSQGNLNAILQENTRAIESRINLLVDEEVRKAKKEWVSVMHSKKAQQLIRPLRESIKKAIRLQREHFAKAKEKIPDYEKKIGWGSVKKIELIKESKINFYKNRERHRIIAREQRSLAASLRSELDQLRREIYEGTRSQSIADEIASSIVTIRQLEETGNVKAVRSEKERLDALTLPFGVASSFKKIADNVASGMRETFYEILIGAKAPPLAKQTLYNRHWRGHDSGVPLFETGEFADSLKAEVI